MPGKDRLKMRHLRTLVAIAEHGSLVRAAKALSISQPAVTKTLAELEDIAGHRLFDRSPKGVCLTGAGRTLVRHTGSGLRAIHDGLSSLSASEEGEAPAIAIGALPNVGATVLAPALVRFARFMPRARVTVRTGSNAQLIAALKQGVLDMVIGRMAEPSDMQGLSFEHLYSEPLLLVVRPGHALCLLKQVDPSLLHGYRLVMPDAGTRVREAADRFFLAVGSGLPVQIIETIDLSFGRSYVLQSDAVWCVPLGAIENDLLQGTLVRLPIDTRATEGPVGLTLRVDHVPSEPIQRVSDEVRKSASERFGALSKLNATKP
jgi:LysR family pca operon transcriptional activator